MKQKTSIRKSFDRYNFQGQIERGKIPVNWGGHYRSGNDNKPNILDTKYLYQNLSMLSFAANEDDLKLAIDNNQWFRFKKSRSLLECYECSETIELETNGKEFRCTNPCRYPNGIGPIVFELNVPSGKIVVANDLRTQFPVIGEHNINASYGIYKTILDYAEAGLAHCFVGNSCPGVFQVSSKKFLIGNESSTNKNPSWDNKKSKRVAGICTDLWWYSICDYDEFARRTNVKDYEKDFKIVTCEPGVYQFKHVYGELDHDDFKNAQVFTFVEYIREADPIKDYQTKYNNLNLNAGQIIYESISSYPTLFGKHDTEGIRAAADQIMCVIGNGYDYHPNGFWSASPNLTNDSPSVAIPVFEGKYNWYPLSDYSTISEIAGIASDGKIAIKGEIAFVNDSFIALAFNICRCIVLYGAFGFGNTEKDRRQTAKETISMATKCLKALKKKYPTKIPSNCKNL